VRLRDSPPQPGRGWGRGFGGPETFSDAEPPSLTLPLWGRGIAYGIEPLFPFVLSLSKDLISFCSKEGMGFDKLSPNGWRTAHESICDSPAIKGEVGRGCSAAGEYSPTP
jgi:hypothetical protein